MKINRREDVGVICLDGLHRQVQLLEIFRDHSTLFLDLQFGHSSQLCLVRGFSWGSNRRELFKEAEAQEVVCLSFLYVQR